MTTLVVTAVPEPGTCALLCAGLARFGSIAPTEVAEQNLAHRRRRNGAVGAPSVAALLQFAQA